MPNANRHDIHVLNGLIQGVIDSADGYREASNEAEDAARRDLFARLHLERRQIAEELQAAVRALGGDPASDGSILAKAQRAFADVRHALMRDDDGILGATEAAESALRGRFERALEDDHISATTRETIRRAYAAVSRDREALRDRRFDAARDGASPQFPH